MRKRYFIGLYLIKFGNKADNGTTKCHVFHDITIYIRLGRTSEL